MGCTSAADEPDYGTMYPTEIKDRNGNQIIVSYNQERSRRDQPSPALRPHVAPQHPEGND
jgi:hypothetical protein